MARRRSFLDSGEVDEVAARAGLIDAAAARPVETARPVRFSYTGSSLVVGPADGDAAWATRTLATDADPDAHPRLLRLRATAPPGAPAPAAAAVLEWAASCADARAGALCDPDGNVISAFLADDWPVGAWARLATAARAIAEPRQGLSLALPVVGGVLRVCFSGLQPEAPSLLLLAESDPGDAFGDELGALVGRLLSPALGAPSGPQPVETTPSAPIARSEAPDAAASDTAERPTVEDSASSPEQGTSSTGSPVQEASETPVAPMPATTSDPAPPRAIEVYRTRPEPVVETESEGVLVDDLLHLLDRAPAPRWSRLRVAVRTRIPPSRLQLGNHFTREERALIRYAVGRVLVMEVP